MLKALIPYLSCLLLATFCHAQTTTPETSTATKKNRKQEIDTTRLQFPRKPMLWKVEGKDLQKPSYLFGSIHLGDDNIVKLHPRVEAAYLASDTLATEVSMSLVNQLASAQFIKRKDSKTLKQAIGADLHSQLQLEIETITPLFHIDQLKEYKTWGAMVTLSMLEEFGEHFAPLDFVLWQRAESDDKVLWALESNKDQLGGFDQLTEKEQIILLKDTLTTLKLFRKEGISSLDMLRVPYLKGDTQAILDSLNQYADIEGVDKAVSEKFYKLMLTDRNIRMADKIASQLTEQPKKSHFMVAGTLHYLGDDSVVKLLQSKGYKVTLQQ